jgi:formate-dependent nitrite reductase membrane component NrfD
VSEDGRRGEPRDGRNIDPEVGILEGEASRQAVPDGRGRGEGTVPYAVWPDVPTRQEPDGTTYYDRPVLKEPVWIWAVPAYFYSGGVAGAAAVLGAAAQVADDGDTPHLRDLVVRCRWVAATGGALGTGFLIHDLGRPGRFLNMLRVFRPTSPMSVGSWALAGAVPLMAGSAILARRRGPLRRLGDLAGTVAGLVGMPLAGYTAVLLSNTAVPLWQETRRSLPAAFTASAMSGAASLLDLMDLDERSERIVRRFGLVGKIAEIAAMRAVESEADRTERVARPLHEGLGGTLWRASRALTGASLVFSLLPIKRSRRAARTAAGILGTAGSIALRFAVFHAGKASARDPRATFRHQRSGHGGVEITGRTAVTGAWEALSPLDDRAR